MLKFQIPESELVEENNLSVHRSSKFNRTRRYTISNLSQIPACENITWEIKQLKKYPLSPTCFVFLLCENQYLDFFSTKHS